MRDWPGYICLQGNILGRRPEPPLVGTGLPPGGRCHHLPLGNPLVSPAVWPADPGQDIPGEGGEHWKREEEIYFYQRLIDQNLRNVI